ncbi:hypothetical protein HY634_04265 [Candidatus Uhrbacteria bacterium]|nr:hypothetical protein [Candidatus Uhrbacteria bacterium]
MELLVALGIFAISVGLIADLFLSATRQQARTVAMSHAQGDARLITETIARELREGSLDLRADIPSGVLALRGGDGSTIQFQRVLAGDLVRPCPSGTTACLFIGRGSSSDAITWAPLTGTDIAVSAFHFWTAPSVDPFAWDAERSRFPANEQPRVTFFLALAAVGGRPGAQASIEAQTTVVSRVYRR